MKKFDKRTAIVTGGASGIGGGCAKKLASEGATVLIVDINEITSKKTVESIIANGGSAEYLIGNVSEESIAKQMVDQAMAMTGRLDFLIQNAYSHTSDSGSAMKTTSEEWDTGIGLLAKALFFGAKYSVPAMTESGNVTGVKSIEWSGFGLRDGEPPKQNIGRIINISSVHGILQAPKSLVYASGKAAVIGLTRQMAIDFGELGITVNTIAPGHIVTERGQNAWEKHGDKKEFHLFELQYPVRRTGTPEDIASSVSFLCSDEASFITGTTLTIDGGLSIQLQENIVMRLKDYMSENPEIKTPKDSNKNSKKKN